jgi:hypothetical protein
LFLPKGEVVGRALKPGHYMSAAAIIHGSTGGAADSSDDELMLDIATFRPYEELCKPAAVLTRADPIEVPLQQLVPIAEPALKK